MIHALVLVLNLAATSAGPTAFADQLMREGDYFRAITEYKRALFDSPGPAVGQRSRLLIARAYRRSARYASAVPYATSLAGDSAASASMRRAAHLELGLGYLAWGRPTLGTPHFEAAAIGDSTGFAKLGLALIDLETDQPDRAASAFRRLALERPDSASRGDLLDLAADTETFAHAPKTSPRLATALSFAVPGAGQIYSGHLYDGLQAFAFVGTLVFSTAAIYKYERDVKHHLGWTYVGMSLTGVFHAANLFGANRTAHFRNWRRRLDFNRAARDRVMRYEPQPQ